MAQIISRDLFMRAKIDQQIELWKHNSLSTADMVDYVLAHGTDTDVEWLCANFDPEETITKY